MLKTKKIKKQYTDYMFDHTGVRLFLEYAFTTVICILSALIYAFGFRAFIAPQITGITSLVAGGLSGLSQNLVLLLKIIYGGNFGTVSMTNTLQSVFYFVFNIPLFFLAYKGVGKRFAIFTFLNVVLVSVFIKFLPQISIPDIVNNAGAPGMGDTLGRALFAGICAGLSSALAFKFEISAGGMDVVSYYFAYHKSTSVGKYSIALNSAVVLLYTLLSYIYDPSLGWGALMIALYAVVYLFTSVLVVDAMNTRNKKAEVQIITSKTNLPKIILANFPHSCTVTPAKGGFSNEDRIIIYIVVSSFEVTKLVKLVQTVDHDSFINVSNSTQVYGRFFIKPVK
ncbi:MAG: YitT family protein [Firmicutes bacterium]|nr:YitT family protein [Bacillota bacterium]